ncbi:hypothetical protein ACO0LG_21235 [Undibacterium sp. Ji42W]|uniref:hypothetical protein n=1 Tax=Undibacterium sp. Ji42W TaxID=3413039 RepID=UPI003BF24935
MYRYLFSFALFCAATNAVASVYENSINVTFPDKVATLTFSEKKEFPKKELGVNIRYQSSGPVIGSIYIYNAGLGQIPTGVGSPIVHKHFAQVIDEVKQLAAMGQVKAVNMAVGGSTISSLKGCGPQFMWRAYELDMGDKVLSSYTYLTGLNNNFVKLRMSHLKTDVQGKRDVEQFVEGIRKVLGNCKD